MIDVILCLGAAIAAAASWGLLMIGIGTVIQRCSKAQKNKTTKVNGGKQMNEIKAGDRVRCISGKEDVGLLSYPKKGTVGTVLCVDEDGFALVRWPNKTVPLNDDRCAYIWYAALRRLEKVEAFNPGDRVVVVDDSGIYTPPNGTVGTVVSTTSRGGVWVMWPSGATLWCVNERVELAKTPVKVTQTQKQTGCEKSKPENELPFAPGDKVRYTANGDMMFYPKRGTVGEVVHSERDGITLARWPEGTVLLNGSVCEWRASNKNLELVRDEIHVGDIVRMKNIKEVLAFHEEHPSWYPKQSVVGRVVGIEQDMARVEWEAGSVERNSSGGFAWYIAQKRLSVVFAKKQVLT